MSTTSSLSTLRAAATWAVLLALSGCSTLGPNFTAPTVAAPAQWADWHGGDASLAAPATAGSASLPADRWAVFQDPALARLQAQALETSPDLRMATLRLLQARAEQTTVSAQHGLQVNAQAGLSRQRLSENGASTRLVGAIGGSNKSALIDVLSAPFTLAQTGFDASWEPDLWGRALRSDEAAQAGTDNRRAQLDQVQLSLRAEVARAYFQLRGAQRQQQIATQALGTAQALAGRLLAQHLNGLSDSTALLRQQALVASLQAAQPALLAQEALWLNQLTLLCGQSPGDLNAALHAGATTPATALPELTDLPDLQLGLPAELARARPDIAAAEAQLRGTTAQIGVAVADLYPRVRLGANFGTEAVGTTNWADWGSRQWSIGPSLSLPIFDQGRRRATVTLRELQQQEALVAFQKTVLGAWHEVDSAVSNYVAQSQREEQLQARLDATAQQVQLDQVRLRQGLLSDLPLLGATSAALDAQRERSDASTQRRVALVAVIKALGQTTDSAPAAAAAAP